MSSIASHRINIAQKLEFYTNRNQNIASSINFKHVFDTILKVSIALAQKQLPAYVLLEIVDFLPFFRCFNHKRKIDLIIKVKKTIDKIRNK